MGYTAKGSLPKYHGTKIARAICSGDLEAARNLFHAHVYKFKDVVAWRVSEIRAIAGACRYAQKVWNAPVTREEFMVNPFSRPSIDDYLRADEEGRWFGKSRGGDESRSKKK